MGGFLYELTLIFIVLFIHETGHILIAKKYGLKVISLKIYPFGMILSLDGVESLSKIKTITLYLGGILFQIICILVLFGLNFQVPQLFLIINIVVIILNLLPIAPLDGYNILFQTLHFFFNYNITAVVMLTLASLLIINLFIFFCFNFNLNYLAITTYLFFYNLKLYHNRDIIILSKIASTYF